MCHAPQRKNKVRHEHNPNILIGKISSGVDNDRERGRARSLLPSTETRAECVAEKAAAGTAAEASLLAKQT